MNKEELIQMLKEESDEYHPEFEYDIRYGFERAIEMIEEIEEPLYEVKMPGTEEFLTQDEDGDLYFDENVGSLSDLIDYIKQKFTEQELKAINKVYWDLAKEVSR